MRHHPPSLFDLRRPAWGLEDLEKGSVSWMHVDRFGECDGDDDDDVVDDDVGWTLCIVWHRF